MKANGLARLSIFVVLALAILLKAQETNVVEKDFRDLKAKAEQGDAEAAYEVGARYDRGYGVAKDSNQAVRWFVKAANQGNLKAQNHLGNCFAHGSGVPKNYVEAYKWWNLAASHGHLAGC
jgi:TPR repeat protein